MSSCVLELKGLTQDVIGHFQDAASLCFKKEAKYEAFLVKIIFYYHAN